MHAAPGDPPRSARREILYDEQAQLDHTNDVLPRYRFIVEIVQEDIDEGIFPNGSGVRRVLDAIMPEAQGTLLYRRHRLRTWEIDDREGIGEVVRHTQ